jgi:dihydrofolate reductase
MDGGETGLDDAYAAKAIANTGASIMGRNMFGPVRGPWVDDASGQPWNGWWGDDPPFHTPVFVLTHHPREPLELTGGTKFYFVTHGIEAALEQALDAASGKDVAIGGGADTVRQYLRARLVDELEIHVSPLLLGAGERLLERVEEGLRGFECVGLAASDAAAHFTYVRATAE